MGIVIYVLRVKKGYRSLPEAINARYGPLASVAFGEAPCLPFLTFWPLMLYAIIYITQMHAQRHVGSQRNLDRFQQASR